MSPLVDGTSYWIESTPGTDLPQLGHDIEVDVCIVGGGITGLLTAWEVVEAGFTACVLEKERVASSVTGYTTAKLTSQHGRRYSYLEREQGLDAARHYGAANQRALERVFAIAAQVDADDAVQRRDSYVYATSADGVEAVHHEAEVAQRAGLPARFTSSVPLPFETSGAVGFADQGQLHPRRLLLALVDALRDRGCEVYEGTKAIELEAGQPATVRTEGGSSVRAGHVVQATLIPSLAGSELLQHLYCHQGYAIATRLDEGSGGGGGERGGDPLGGGVYITSERPMRSLRTIEVPGGGRLLQVGGAAWVGNPNAGDMPWDDLDEFARDHFAAGPASWRWTTQDYSSTDEVPLIGSLGGEHANVYVATGYAGWGMTTAGVAAEIVRDLVRDEHRDWHRMFDPRRELPEATTEIVSAHRSGLRVDAEQAMARLAPGEAVVVHHEGEEIAAYRDDDGTLHRRSAVCTHLRCIVLWDPGDRQWECPCHGSRFAPDGEVVSGPADEPLARR